MVVVVVVVVWVAAMWGEITLLVFLYVHDTSTHFTLNLNLAINSLESTPTSPNHNTHLNRHPTPRPFAEPRSMLACPSPRTATWRRQPAHIMPMHMRIEESERPRCPTPSNLLNSS